MKILKAAAIAFLAAPIATIAIAQGESDRTDKQRVMQTLSGSVTKTDGNKLLIDAETGPVLVTTGPTWHHKLDIPVGETIEVTGEVGEFDMDAFSIKRADGAVVDIRPVEGPPPWVMAELRDRRKGPPPWAGRGDDDRDWREDRDERGPPPWARDGDRRD